MAENSRDHSNLQTQSFDALIVGGGISGAWIALYCARLGLKTALIEQHDFASQTSSASSKLLHGGIRYLQQMQFDKVRESAIERAHFLYAAPHLSNPVPFIIPTYKDIKRSKLFLACGMLVYKALRFGEKNIIESRSKAMPATKSLSINDLNSICDLSHIEHTGAIVFPEYHMYDSERMVLSILKSATELGATTANYVSAKQYLNKDNNVSGVLAKDTLSGQEFEIQSKLVINAAGPWIDNLNHSIDKQAGISGFAVGSHIITRQLISDHAIALTTKHKSATKIDRGGRHIFIIPWRGHSLIGTSYDELNDPNQTLKVTPEEVEQLILDVNDALPGINLTKQDVISGYTGIYPLHTENIQSSVYQGSGEYQIIDHQQSQNIDGLITALGAKFTTGRILAEKTMKLIQEKLPNTSSDIGKIKLHNSQYKNLPNFIEQKQKQYQYLFSSQTIEHLVHNYGSDIDEFINFIDSDKTLLKPISSKQPDILGQAAWAIEHEMALTLNDVLFRRTSIGLLGITENEVANVAKLMANYLQWNSKQTKHQINAAMEKINMVKSASSD